MNKKISFLSIALGVVCTLALGCGGGGGSDSSGSKISFTVPIIGGQIVDQSLIVTDDSDNTLTFDSVEVVVRELEFELEDADDDCDDALAGDDDCADVKLGPFVVALNLDGSMKTAVSANVPAGLYDEVEFDVHKVSSGDAEDAKFLAANPDFEDVSVRVLGSFNGNSFTYTSDMMDKQEVDFSPALEVLDGEPVNVTIQIDVTSWFTDSSGDLIDPETANDGGSNESEVDNNIKDSFDAFEDDDKDGVAVDTRLGEQVCDNQGDPPPAGNSRGRFASQRYKRGPRPRNRPPQTPTYCGSCADD